MYLICATGGTVLIVLSPEYSHAMYLDSSKNLRKKDYMHIQSVIDSALLTFSLSGGYIKVKKYRNRGLAFGHKNDFCCIQQPHTRMACITYSSIEGIINAFACHLLPTVSRLSAGPQA